MGAPRWPEVFHDHFTFVHSVTRRLAGPQLDADDLTQEVFVVVYRRLDSLRDPDRLRSWIYGICRRVVAHRRRRQKIRRALREVLGTGPEHHAATPEDATHRRQLELRLYEALDRLSPRRREVLVLFALEELSGSEIADLLEIPVNTVWTRLHAARRDLLRHLKRVGIESSLPLGAQR